MSLQKSKEIPEIEIPGLFLLLNLYLNVIVVFFFSSCVLPLQSWWEEKISKLCLYILYNYNWCCYLACPSYN